MIFRLPSLVPFACLALASVSPQLFGQQYQYFDDVPPTAPYYGVANALWERQITKGCYYSPHQFCPDSIVTRADAAVLVVRAIYSSLTGNAEGFTAPSAQYFDDVPPTHPRFQYIQQMKFLGITNGCSAVPALYCPDTQIPLNSMAVFTVRARQIRDSSITSYGYIYSIGTVNNAIACPADFSCNAYFPYDVPSSDVRFPFVQKARELAGPMVQTPLCGSFFFCPDVVTTRGQMAFFVTYGILGYAGLPPQIYYQGGYGSPLPAVSGVDCYGTVTYSNEIYLLSPQDYYASASTRGTFNDISLWTMTVTANVKRDGITVFPQPALPTKSNTDATLRFPATLLEFQRMFPDCRAST